MRFTVFIICLLFSFSVFGQQQYSRTDLENRRKQILEAIHETEQQLEITKKDKRATIGQLRALQNKLAERQHLIGNINDEITDISSNIKTSGQEVTQLRQNLEQLKIRYAQSLRYAYETRSSYDMLAFIFSSNDFNDAVRRIKYLKRYRDYRKEEVAEIRVTQSQIEHKIGVLNTEKDQKDQLLTSQELQKQTLQKETEETNNVVKDLKGREKELLAEDAKNKKVAQRLDRAISDMIRREIEIARKKAAEEEKRKAELASANARPVGKTTTIVISGPKPKPVANVSSYSLSLTPEVAALSNNFQANKGRLPWPVEKGFIAESFGRHQHAVAEKVMVENDGVEIQTSPNATARAVFDGTVKGIAYVPGMGQLVVIDHGNFFTAYSRLGNVTVKKGDKVHIKQPIGTVILNDDNVPMIHFELWRVGSNDKPTPVDPATWIAR